LKTVVAFPLRLGLFWLLFFALFRLWFVLWFRHDWSPQEPLSAWKAFWHALPLDMSMAGYLLLLPVLFWFIGLLIGPKAYPVFNSLISGFNFLIITAFVFIFGANIFIYEEWHTPLNHRAVEYLSTPRALLDSMSFGFKLVAVGLFVGGVWAVWQAYKRIVERELYPKTISRWGFLALPVWVGLLALAIRGGLGVMPINESAVYYSVHAFNNHAATNTAWYLAHSQLETRSTENHYRFMPDKEAVEQVDFLMKNGHSDIPLQMNLLESLPDSARLNVVFIIMESMTAQVVEELGGEKGVCPNLSRLIREGILFENIYGSGYRTDQGVVSILGGYPAQPDQSIVLLSDKAEKIRSLPMILYEQGYSTAFFYGGELTFANIGVWLRNQKMEVIRSEPDFPSADKTQRWGVDDYKLLQHSIQEINQLRPPFLAAAMTLSLHPPFDVPYQSKWQNGGTEAHLFLHSAAFADYAIGEFFKTAEQQAWYNNTLFVLVADHGASHPGAAGMDDPRSRHIPLILFGKPIHQEWIGKKVDVFGNHHDIPATVLHTITGKPVVDIPWSRDLWDLHGVVNAYRNDANEKLDFAYYTNENGLGWLNRQGAGFYYFENKQWNWWRGQIDSTGQKQAKAYLQTLYEDFLKK